MQCVGNCRFLYVKADGSHSCHCVYLWSFLPTFLFRQLTTPRGVFLWKLTVAHQLNKFVPSYGTLKVRCRVHTTLPQRHFLDLYKFSPLPCSLEGTRKRVWLRHSTTTRKVAGSIPYEALDFSIGPVVDSASNRNDCWESSWG
jgi:hypothetical protein